MVKTQTTNGPALISCYASAKRHFILLCCCNTCLIYGIYILDEPASYASHRHTDSELVDLVGHSLSQDVGLMGASWGIPKKRKGDGTVCAG